MTLSELGLTMAGEPGPGHRASRRRRRQRGNSTAVIALVVIVAIVGGVGYYGIRAGTAWVHDRFRGADYSGAGTGAVEIEVKAGDTARRIGRTLETADVVRSAQAFASASGDDPRSAGLQPGFYRLRRHMSAALALRMMLDPASRAGVLIVPEGTRASRVLELAAARSGIPLTQLRAAVRRGGDLGLPAYAKGNVEGFLFPDRYDVNKKMPARQVLAAMVARYQTRTAGLDVDGDAQKLGISPYEALIVASLVQAEASRAEDFGKVARVVYNRLGARLAVDRRLQFDSTINYARNTSTLNLTFKQIQALKSPYNSYTHPGLPPTPIGNPGLDALRAALNPTPGNWRYFVTVNATTGETRFTDNLAQFNEWKAESKKNRGL